MRMTVPYIHACVCVSLLSHPCEYVFTFSLAVAKRVASAFIARQLIGDLWAGIILISCILTASNISTSPEMSLCLGVGGGDTGCPKGAKGLDATEGCAGYAIKQFSGDDVSAQAPNNKDDRLLNRCCWPCTNDPFLPFGLGTVSKLCSSFMLRMSYRKIWRSSTTIILRRFILTANTGSGNFSSQIEELFYIQEMSTCVSLIIHCLHALLPWYW